MTTIRQASSTFQAAAHSNDPRSWTYLANDVDSSIAGMAGLSASVQPIAVLPNTDALHLSWAVKSLQGHQISVVVDDPDCSPDAGPIAIGICSIFSHVAGEA